MNGMKNFQLAGLLLAVAMTACSDSTAPTSPTKTNELSKASHSGSVAASASGYDQKSLATPNKSQNAEIVTSPEIVAGFALKRIDAGYVDVWHYGNTPQLYLFSGNQYGRFDIVKNKFEGATSISTGYPGLPFKSIDAAYVDVWHYNGTPQLYLFSGTQYARFDIKKNKFEGVGSISTGYTGVPFKSFDAAYVDVWHYNGTPQLYIFNGARYARYDILKNKFEGVTDKLIDS